MTETNRVEYKRELTSELDIEKEVVAFLNYKEGGYIYIGIDKDGSTVGISDVDDCMLRLKDRIKHNISPSAMGLFDIAEEQKEGRSIIKVTVASGIEKPYFKTKYGMTPRGAYILRCGIGRVVRLWYSSYFASIRRRLFQVYGQLYPYYFAYKCARWHPVST